MTLLSRRRGLLVSAKPQYVFVKYLESNGTQFIATDLYLKSEYDIEFKYWISNAVKSTTNQTGLWGCTNTKLDTKWHWSYNYGASVDAVEVYGWRYYANTFTNQTRLAQAPPNVVHTIYTEGDFWYHTTKGAFGNNGVNKMTSGKKSPIPLQIYAVWKSASNKVEPVNFANVRFYYFKVNEGNNVVADFRPCYRSTDGVAGMYDTINDKFYTNAGTGEFIIGGEI